MCKWSGMYTIPDSLYRCDIHATSKDGLVGRRQTLLFISVPNIRELLLFNDTVHGMSSHTHTKEKKTRPAIETSLEHDHLISHMSLSQDKHNTPFYDFSKCSVSYDTLPP
jgi:hypothetical protein